MVDQRERPSYTPLSALLQERRVALSASIPEPEIRTYFEHMVGFQIRSAMRNETPGRHRWMIAVSYQEDALFLHELEGLNQRGVYKFIESAVSAELAKAEAELHGFLNPRPKKDKEETSDVAKLKDFSDMAQTGRGILTRNNLSPEAHKFLRKSVDLFQATGESTIEATKVAHIVECTARVTVLRSLNNQISERLTAPHKASKPAPVRELVAV